MKIAVGIKTDKPDIFLCYRREDSVSETSRLYQDLVHEYSAENVFMDVDSLPLGENFPEYIQKRIISCTVVLVIIGKNWLTVSKTGLRRIDVPQDHVRREIRYALENKKVIIPILVQNEMLPDGNNLPSDIKEISQLQALVLNYNYWNLDLKKLKNSLKPQKRPFPFLIITDFVLLAAFLTFFIVSKTNTPDIHLSASPTKGRLALNIHLYQLDPPNYNADILKFLMQIINSKNTTFRFVIHTQRQLPYAIVVRETMQVNDRLLKSYPRLYKDTALKTLKLTQSSHTIRSLKSYPRLHIDTALKLMQSFHTIRSNVDSTVVVGLVPYSLQTSHTFNLFSAASYRYSVVSTLDWDNKVFHPISIYRYIIYQVTQTAIISSPHNRKKLLKYHSTDITVGCLFDYQFEKTGIKNSIVNGIICSEHKQIIKNLFGEKFLEDFEFIVMFQWLDDETKRKLKETYGYVV